MDRDEAVMELTNLGLILLVVSFIAYILVPNVILIGTFVVGLILLVAGYTFVNIRTRAIGREINVRFETAERDGYILSLDGDYVPERDDATIENLG